jgi:hypothetical protein
VLHAWVKHSIAVALLATLFSSPVPAVWAAQLENADKAKGDKPKVDKDKITNNEIEQALTGPPNVPPEAQDLKSSFLDHTLPRLLANDDRLARQLGFGDSMNNTVILDRALPLMLIYRNDVFKFVRGESKPLDLVNNTNNWMKDAGRLVPNRIVFSLEVNNSTSEAGPYSWSSVILEKSPEGSWRIIQFGAPKLSRAMRLFFEAPETNQFLLWIPDLNRHYLGQISAAGSDVADPSIILTALFDDQLAHRRAGERFDVTSGKYIEHLKHLYKDLDLPKKLHDDSDQNQIQIQAR